MLTLCSVISFGCLVVSQVELFQASVWFWLCLPFLLFTVVYYLVSLRVNSFTPNFDVKEHRRLVRSWKPERYPTVDVFLPVCGEPLETLHNTWIHVRKLREQYPGLVTPYVLDDAASPEVEAMAADFGFQYGTRENRGWFKKAGNLHYGFGRSDGTYILILDADFAPRHDLLEELLPYFERDPGLGIVQSPQYFRVLDSQNWIERGAGAIQELFYRTVQVARQRNDGAICVGSCAVYRRAALEENGGTTLIAHSEDVHTGFDLRALGWDLQYVPVALSTGVCPDSLGAFQNQQYRWCMGSMSLLTSHKFWHTKLSLTTRLCYVSGFLYYIHTALLTFAMPLLPIMLLLCRPDLLQVKHLLLVIPSLVYATLIFPLWHRAPYRLEAWATRMMFGWAHFFAIWDLLRRRPQGWRPTGSSGARKNRQLRFWIGLIGWGGTTALVWVVAAVYRMFTLHPPDFALVLSSGLFYAVTVGRILIQPRSQEVTG
ncbi:cellulose synthase catalytic subunit [Kitasatospora sp. RB6PN24]|uniref:glycosyltransferase family 2 protein n=1 Tax=Kitasatospora humi TaxID=2893891 RepID=UPI001E2D3221|nr:cellulose synthase catalytic subunit [Kitasatospora humi]MCC9309636.1 cellulose synthase catalytic subunit [Kitasatospora humi]